MPIGHRFGVANGWLIALGLLSAYVLFVFWIVQTGRLQRWNLSLMLGIILMVRTQRGRGLIEWVAKPRRLWNALGDASTVLTLFGMAAMTLVFTWSVWYSLQPDSGVEPLGASEILVIPGVNPFVPLWYGIFALIVTLVVHEGGHGVLARANRMRLKSLGLLFAIVPVGAFVEPDEEDLKSSSRRRRLRVFAAGPAVNLGVATLVLLAMAAAVSAVEPVPGVHIATVTKDQPAQEAGIAPGDSLLSIDGRTVSDWGGFARILDQRAPGDEVRLGLHDGRTVEATLTSRWHAVVASDRQDILAGNDRGDALCESRYGENGPHGSECAERLQSEAFLGVGPVPLDVRGVLSDPFGSTRSFLQVISLPIGEVRGAPTLSTYLPTFHEAPGNDAAYWVLVRLLFWVFWINLMVGLTNILPMLPLDGGHIFRDALGGVVERLRPGIDPRRLDRVVGWTSGFVSIFILGAFLLQIFGPRLVGAS